MVRVPSRQSEREEGSGRSHSPPFVLGTDY